MGEWLGDFYGTQTGRYRILDYPFNAVAKQFVLTAYFCTADYASKNDDVLARFRRALSESVAYVNAHRAAIISVMAKYLGVDEATIAATPPIPLAQPRQLDVALIQPLIDIAVKYKAIDRGFGAKELIDVSAKRRPRPYSGGWRRTSARRPASRRPSRRC